MAGSLRCTTVARALGYRPAGTAGSAAAFVLVEAPLPWPSDVGTHPLLAPLAPVVGGAGGRLQAVVPQGDTPAGEVRVVVLRRSPGPFTTFDRAERSVPVDGLTEALAELLAPAGVAGEAETEADTQADNGGGAEAGGPAGASVTDVLVCTHGSRDVCCGADGMRLYGELVALDLPDLRVWRTSHTGGHRFAPTALTFPDGRAWAWLDPDRVRGIVDRSLPAAEAAAHDRGCTAFPDPWAQAAESAVLAAEGWGWLDRPREVTVEEVADDHRRVLVAAAAAGGPRYGAEVALVRTVAVPDCGHPLEEARKSSPDLEVTALRRLDP